MLGGSSLLGASVSANNSVCVCVSKCGVVIIVDIQTDENTEEEDGGPDE